MAAAGLELEATGALAPAQLSATGRRELRHLLRSYNLEVAGIFCPLRRGLAVQENQEARLEYLRQALAMSYELGTKVVIIEPGPLPAGADDPRGPLLRDALETLARHGDRVGGVLALETGLDAGDKLSDYLAQFDTGALGVCFNPGNLLAHGQAPFEAARALGPRIVAVHARDARMASAGRSAEEVPLGQGDIDWLAMMGLLEEIDYRGWLTIVRHTPLTMSQAAASVQFLQRLG